MVKLFTKIGEGIGNAQTFLAETIISIRPELTAKLKLKSFTWGDIASIGKPRHSMYAIIGIALVVATSFILTRLPVLDLSILGSIELLIQTIFKLFGKDVDVIPYSTPIFIVLMVLWRNQVGSIFGVGPKGFVAGLPWFAMREELAFRLGSEKWSFTERVRSCLSFGLIHITMIIVPIGIAIGLSLGGAIFMFVYLRVYKLTGSRREAIKESATVHTLYNLLLISALVIFVITILLT